MEQRILGDYKIIKPIGQGTLGTVYIGEHRFMKRQYIIKILPEELSSDRAFIKRFEEEIHSLASLEHPNIVKIHNISFAQGQYFLVGDCIVDDYGETTNLSQYMIGLRRPLNENEIFDILLQIAVALDYAHGKKIGNNELVHRSLKPNNILIGKGKQKIEVYLSDFGLSSIIGAGAVLTRTFKNTAEALGIALPSIIQKAGLDRYPASPLEQNVLIPLHASFLQTFAFLAPEQKRLDSIHPITGKSDVFAFGVLAYFLLMNELPEGIFEMPSINPRYDLEWDQLIKSCLQSKPQKRPDLLVPLLETMKLDKVQIIVEEPKNAIEKIHELGNEPLSADLSSAESEQVNDSSLTNNLSPQAKLTTFFENNETQETKSRNDEEELIPVKPNIQASQIQRPKTDLNPGAIFQNQPTVKTYSPEPKNISDIQPLLTDMIIIPGGNFYRGSHDGNRDEMPRHQITLPNFAIDIHPVTNEQFVRFLEVMGGEKDSNHNDIIRLRDSRIKRSGGKLNIESGYAKHPVVGVTWHGAVAYAKWIGKRLPTEAEWEIAARGGQESALYPTGDDIEKTQANFFSSDTTSVMSYAATSLGLYDMAGNVYEWCFDWYGYNAYEKSMQEPINPQGPFQGVYRVLKGGCWKSLKEDLRCSKRHRNNPGTVNSTYGFRCAADVKTLDSLRT